MTDHAKKLLFSDLRKLSNSPAEWIKILDQSTMRSWQGVFSLKQDYSLDHNTAKPKYANGFTGSWSDLADELEREMDV